MIAAFRWPTRNGLPPAAWSIGLGVGVAALALASGPAEISPGRVVRSIVPMLLFARSLITLPPADYVPTLGGELVETVEMAFVATCIAIVFSLPLAVMATRERMIPRPLAGATRALLGVIRGLPELMWAMLFVSATGLGPLPGVLAVAFVTIGFLGKLFAEALDAVSTGPVEALRALGADVVQINAYAILPLALPDLVSIVLYVVDHNVRAASILGLVGAGGVGYDMVMSVRLFEYGHLLLISLGIYAIVTILDRISVTLRARAI
jgi:phosphonate transport system permease protein